MRYKSLINKFLRVRVGEGDELLAKGIWKDPNDQYIACRVRKHTDIVVGNMRSPQEVQTLNRRHLRVEKDLLVHHHMSGDNEWKTGGCPFARREVLEA